MTTPTDVRSVSATFSKPGMLLGISDAPNRNRRWLRWPVIMKEPEEPLVWPDDYPPTDPLKKFFLGIRWLGPDLKFFNELCQQQAGRIEENMAMWSTTAEHQTALMMGRHFRRACGWRTDFFLPDDRFSVVVYGPRFQTLETAFLEEATAGIEKELGGGIRRCLLAEGRGIDLW